MVQFGKFIAVPDELVMDENLFTSNIGDNDSDHMRADPNNETTRMPSASQVLPAPPQVQGDSRPNMVQPNHMGMIQQHQHFASLEHPQEEKQQGGFQRPEFSISQAIRSQQNEILRGMDDSSLSFGMGLAAQRPNMGMNDFGLLAAQRARLMDSMQDSMGNSPNTSMHAAQPKMNQGSMNRNWAGMGQSLPNQARQSGGLGFPVPQTMQNFSYQNPHGLYPLQQQEQQQQLPMEHQLLLQQQLMMNSAPVQREDNMQRLGNTGIGMSLLDGHSSHVALDISQQQQDEVLGALSDLEDDDDDEQSSTPKKTQTRQRRAKAFPEKFMEALVGFSDESVLAWLPDGKSFVVVNDEAFVDQILTKHFKAAKYSSFVRKLHRWGFVRLTSGTGTDCFHHPMFQKNRLDMAAQIKSAPRTKIKRKPRGSAVTGVEQFMRQKAEAAVAVGPRSASTGSNLPPSMSNTAVGQSIPFAQQQMAARSMTNPDFTAASSTSDVADIPEPNPFPSDHAWGA